jgi:hypothetical protein
MGHPIPRKNKEGTGLTTAKIKNPFIDGTSHPTQAILFPSQGNTKTLNPKISITFYMHLFSPRVFLCNIIPSQVILFSSQDGMSRFKHKLSSPSSVAEAVVVPSPKCAIALFVVV